MEKTNKKCTTISVKLIVGLSILAIVFIISGILFYWFAIRPSQIRKECAFIEIVSYTQEEKDIAKKYLEDKCSISKTDLIRVKLKYGSESISQECRNNMNIVLAPAGNENQKRNATDKEYAECLRKRGLNNQKSLSSKQLKTIQQGIDDQSTKMDSLQTQTEDLQKENISAQQKATSLDTQILQQQQVQQDYQDEQEYELKSYQSCVDMWTATDGGNIKSEHERLCR